MIAVDASTLIAVLSPADEHYESACQLVDDHLTDRIVIHSVNLAEVYVGPARTGDLARIEQAFNLLEIEPFSMDSDAPARLARLRVSTKLKLPDCCALDAALQFGCPLATFDRRLASAATALGIELVWR